MKISVIIPTYKPQNYLWECLESLVNQTFPREEFEVILVLNGCSEPYKNNIEKFIISNMYGMNVNFIHTKQGGVSNARNIGLDNAKGEYVTFIDDDDFISPKYLELLFKDVDEDTISLCYPYAYNDGEIEKQLSYSLTDVYNEMYQKKELCLSSKVRKFFSGPCMKLIPMSIIQHRHFDLRFKNGEDSLFMFLISDRFKKFAFAPKEAVYYRRIRSGSATTSKMSARYNIINLSRLIVEYSKIYFFTKKHYSLRFYLTRILGAIRSMIFF